ncbi:30S ribosomal protein S14 [Plasmodium vinckei petteri]|uniref:30S ribosomal protein S14 n=1 Tax=Plasmodium vinckei petteri TaxID=138298 RepID=W7AHT4_PLAVN|nr:30S ribosomal protein S14 [Plasmodium vinckei petteri]CAD2104830.1 apicoplast ribosomal protein S14p/S29e precursor, putative [Plasmodium vinckei petteri]
MLNFIKWLIAYFILVQTTAFSIKERHSHYLFLNNYNPIFKKRITQNNINKPHRLNLKKRLDPNNKYTVLKRHEAKIQRNLKRKYLIEKYKEKRALLKKYISEASSPIEYVYWKYKLSSLPRDSCPVRFRNRCAITGRARGYYKFFGLCRHQARALIQKMFFPGFVKASW